jgi:hypothetical protein
MSSYNLGLKSIPHYCPSENTEFYDCTLKKYSIWHNYVFLQEKSLENIQLIVVYLARKTVNEIISYF